MGRHGIGGHGARAGITAAAQRALSSRALEYHRSRGCDRVLYDEVQGGKTEICGASRRGVDRRFLAALQQGRCAAADGNDFRNLAYRLGRGGYESGLSKADRQRYEVSNSTDRYQ